MSRSWDCQVLPALVCVARSKFEVKVRCGRKEDNFVVRTPAVLGVTATNPRYRIPTQSGPVYIQHVIYSTHHVYIIDFHKSTGVT